MQELARNDNGGGLQTSNAPTPADWKTMREQAEVVMKSGMAPKALNSPEKILTVALKGRELAVPMMQALSHIHVVEGRPTLSAEMMVALVQRAGHKLRIIETSTESATVEGVRRDDPDHKPRVTFSMDDAKRAGVANKQVWKSYPDAMLRARAISALCRFAFADVLAGASYVPEELGAEVDEEGTVVQMPTSSAERNGEQASMHKQALSEIREVYDSMPEAERPSEEAIFGYAEQGYEQAWKALKRVKVLAENAGSSDLPAEGAEVVEESEAAPKSLLDYIRDTADMMYADLADSLEGETLAGHEYLQREIGRPIEEFSAEQARAVAEQLDRESQGSPSTGNTDG